MTSKAWATRRAPAASLTRVEETPSQADDIDNNNITNGGSPPPGRKMGLTRLPSIKEKRPRKPRAASFNDAITDSSSMSTSTPRRDSVNSNSGSTTATNGNNTGAPSLARRASIPQPQASTLATARRASRPTFAGIGRRVSSLVKARMAFQTQRKSRGENEVNHMAVIHELPRNARFTSFMSPEAQYAVLKGYEDKLYEKIANTSPPDAVPALNRNRTPFFTKISFDDPAVDNNNATTSSSSSTRNTNDNSRAGTETPQGHGPDGSSGSKSGTSSSSVNGQGGNTPAATRVDNFNAGPDASKPSENASTTTTTITITSTSSSSSSVALPSPFLKPLRRPSVADRSSNNSVTPSPPPPTSMSFSGQTQSQPHHQFQQQRGATDFGGNAGWSSLQRAHSMSSLSTTTPDLSPRKRLVLTYRLESAMDILDTLNRRDKENALSPRVVRLPRKVDAVRDFNSWTEVWNKEFKEAKSK